MSKIMQLVNGNDTFTVYYDVINKRSTTHANFNWSKYKLKPTGINSMLHQLYKQGFKLQEREETNESIGNANR